MPDDSPPDFMMSTDPKWATCTEYKIDQIDDVKVYVMAQGVLAGVIVQDEEGTFYEHLNPEYSYSYKEMFRLTSRMEEVYENG